MSADLQAEYQQYLDRFQTSFGNVEVGGFAKHKGQLIQKLSPEEFGSKRSEFLELYATYESALKRGDTINDMVVRMLRQAAARLLQDDPVLL